MQKIISVIMPALDEAICIANVIYRIPMAEFASRGFDVEILVVDNGSVDGTGDIARKAGARVVSEPRRGYGWAYLKGFREACGDIICTMDADGTYPSSALPGIVDKLIGEDLEFISTDRFHFMTNGVMPRVNKIGNIMLNLASRALFRLPFKDSQSGMWVFRKELIDNMELNSGGMALSQEIKIEAACHLKARCAEYPIHYGYRSGMPKLRPWRDGLGNLAYLMQKRFAKRAGFSN